MLSRQTVEEKSPILSGYTNLKEMSRLGGGEHFTCIWLDHEQIHLWVYNENILDIYKILKVK